MKHETLYLNSNGEVSLCSSLLLLSVCLSYSCRLSLAAEYWLVWWAKYSVEAAELVYCPSIWASRGNNSPRSINAAQVQGALDISRVRGCNSTVARLFICLTAPSRILLKSTRVGHDEMELLREDWKLLAFVLICSPLSPLLTF